MLICQKSCRNEKKIKHSARPQKDLALRSARLRSGQDLFSPVPITHTGNPHASARPAFIPPPDPPPLAGRHGATPPHGTTHHPRHQETEEVPSLNQASCSKTVQAVKRCSSLFRFGGVPSFVTRGFPWHP